VQVPQFLRVRRSLQLPLCFPRRHRGQTPDHDTPILRAALELHSCPSPAPPFLCPPALLIRSCNSAIRSATSRGTPVRFRMSLSAFRASCDLAPSNCL